jgi:hypothetical protein
MKRLPQYLSCVKTCRPAFTLIDVLISAACIGIAIGLLTPDGQTVAERETTPHEPTIIAAAYEGSVDQL